MDLPLPPPELAWDMSNPTEGGKSELCNQHSAAALFQTDKWLPYSVENHSQGAWSPALTICCSTEGHLGKPKWVFHTEKEPLPTGSKLPHLHRYCTAIQVTVTTRSSIFIHDLINDSMVSILLSCDYTWEWDETLYPGSCFNSCTH